MKDTKIKATEFIDLAKEIKSKRLMMGIKAKDFASNNNIHQGNYSKIENGLANPGKYLVIIRVMFNKWRINKLKELENKIELLKSIK